MGLAVAEAGVHQTTLLLLIDSVADEEVVSEEGEEESVLALELVNCDVAEDWVERCAELLDSVLALELWGEETEAVSPVVAWWYEPLSKELLEEAAGVEVELSAKKSRSPEEEEESSLCMARMTKRTRAAMMTE